jgi:hypothetical protein
MVESLAIELVDLEGRAPAPHEELRSEALVQAALDFAWGRIERPWADELAELMGEVLPDVFFEAVEREGADGDRIDLYAAVADRLCELVEELALGLVGTERG